MPIFINISLINYTVFFYIKTEVENAYLISKTIETPVLQVNNVYDNLFIY